MPGNHQLLSSATCNEYARVHVCVCRVSLRRQARFEALYGQVHVCACGHICARLYLFARTHTTHTRNRAAYDRSQFPTSLSRLLFTALVSTGANMRIIQENTSSLIPSATQGFEPLTSPGASVRRPISTHACTHTIMGVHALMHAHNTFCRSLPGAWSAVGLPATEPSHFSRSLQLFEALSLYFRCAQNISKPSDDIHWTTIHINIELKKAKHIIKRCRRRTHC